MIVDVVGLDPSLDHWGITEGTLCLEQGFFTPSAMQVIEPVKLQGKQVRVNSNDLHRAEQLARPVIAACEKAKVVFVEMPVGSQSARAMASYGICVGVMATIRAMGIPLIEVSAADAKKALAGNRNASKQQMIDAGVQAYPEAPWPVYEKNGKGFIKGEIHSKSEHVADALGAIHAGVLTPEFQNLLRLFER
ncbi:hypothetical protein [Aquabacterium sp.]|uniref:hypothetical protein n=1 Tax=Aquabacterium sp. TaxID=1872578 RepID=UPI0025BBA4CF|nr:hypothetical protein [Aquabacterium sp.]